MILTGINATNFEVGAPVSAPVKASMPKLVLAIDALVAPSLLV
jgi:hypothetical protein